MGYAGINNNLAIEFDIQNNAWDPNGNHVSIQSCRSEHQHSGPSARLVHHRLEQQRDQLPVIAERDQHHGSECSATTARSGRCLDGAVHQVVVEYTPPPPNQNMGVLQVWLDPTFIPGTHTPMPNSPTIIAVPYNITFSNSNPTGLNLDGGKGWVGFTGSQPMMSTAQDILAWEFTPHTPLQITQTIPPGGQENDFVFGGYEAAVTYPNGFTNPDGIQMTVLATPVNRNTFYTQRLLGTQFSNETCAVNLETGGNCIVYSVTCQTAGGQPTTCPSETDPTIAMCTQFYTADPITATNADYLKADPIGSNNWASIFTFFQQNLVDPSWVAGAPISRTWLRPSDGMALGR